MIDKMAICAIVRDEENYVVEWIQHHLLIGFTYFVLYDNGSRLSLSLLIDRYALNEFVSVVNWPEFPGQMSAYSNFIKNYANRFDWVAFIDVDEFLIPLGHHKIQQLMKYFEGFTAILVNWLTFGPSGHEQRPSGLVTRNYTFRLPKTHPVNRHVKSIVKVKELVSRSNSPHVFVTSGPQCNGRGDLVDASSFQEPAEFPHFVLYHYLTKSYEDWRTKVTRGRVSTTNPSSQYDDTMFHTIRQEAIVPDTGATFFSDRIELYRALVEG